MSVLLLAAGMQTTPARADGAEWSANTRVSRSSASYDAVAFPMGLAAGPNRLVEAYILDHDLLMREHTSAGWSAGTVAEHLEDLGYLFPPAVAADAATTWVVTQETTGSGFREELRVATFDAARNRLARVELGVGFSPTMVPLGDGSAFMVATASGGRLDAWTVSAAGVVTSVATPVTSTMSLSRPKLLIDGSGAPLFLVAECTADPCDGTVNLLASVYGPSGWSAPSTIGAATYAPELRATAGAGRVLVTWDESDGSKSLSRVGSTWGAVESAPISGQPLIAPDGTQLLVSCYGSAVSRAAGATDWTTIASLPASYTNGCTAAVEDGTAVVHRRAELFNGEGPLILENRLTVTAPTRPLADVEAPGLTFTSVPSGESPDHHPTITFDTPGATTVLCSLNREAFQPCSSPHTITAPGGTNRFLLAASDDAGNWIADTRTWDTDPDAPTATVVLPTAPIAFDTPFRGAWGGTSFSNFDVRVNRAAPTTGFTAWTTKLSQTGTRTFLFPNSTGYTSCISARARGPKGLLSPWASQRCTALPLDDRSLTPSAGWTRMTGSAYYLRTYIRTTRLNATLVSGSLQTQRLALVATRCPSCGTVGVYVNSTLLAKVNLASSSTQIRALINLPRISLRTTKVTLKVLTSGKPVEIDGLGTSRI